VGVVLTALGLAGICAGVALSGGIALGISFIVRTRREAEPLARRVTLRLIEPPA
jgi:hypothetical protein